MENFNILMQKQIRLHSNNTHWSNFITENLWRDKRNKYENLHSADCDRASSFQLKIKIGSIAEHSAIVIKIELKLIKQFDTPTKDMRANNAAC